LGSAVSLDCPLAFAKSFSKWDTSINAHASTRDIAMIDEVALK